jgi:hypothetical protein
MHNTDFLSQGVYRRSVGRVQTGRARSPSSWRVIEWVCSAPAALTVESCSSGLGIIRTRLFVAGETASVNDELTITGRKLQNDSTYREQCCDSREKWRKQHPDYMRNYRRKNGRRSTKATPAMPESSPGLNRILDWVKNKVDLGLTCYERSISVLVISSNEHVKNILATAELILVEALPKKDWT